MKVCILIAGFCRPDRKYCVENIAILKSCFDQARIEYKTIFVDDLNSNSKYIKRNIKLDSTILLKKDDIKLRSQFPKVYCCNAIKRGIVLQDNIWMLRQKIKIGLDYIKEFYSDYTHICLARPCTRVIFNPLKCKDFCYNVWCGDFLSIDDRFGFATKEIMYKLWDYGDGKVLKQFNKVNSSEEFLSMLADRNKIAAVAIPGMKLFIRPETI